MTNKPDSKPHWRLVFDVSPDLKARTDGKTYQTATAIAEHGDFSYIAEVELGNWAQDIAAFFKQVQGACFQTETAGLPHFPDMNAPSETSEHPPEPAPEPEPTSAAEAEETGTFEPELDMPAKDNDYDGDYEMTLYAPPEGEEVPSGQATLF